MFIKSDIAIISLIFVWCSVFSILTQARDAKPEDCDPGREEYNSCGVLPSCEINCDKPDIRACAKICSPGCFCVKPYIRECENSTSCVTQEECDERVNY